MPEERLGKIMTATDSADVATLAMIEAMRQIADNGKATNRILEAVQGELREMQAEVRDVRERVIRIEASEFKTELTAVKVETERLRKEDLSKMDARLTALELDRAERTGGVKFADALLKYGPFVIAAATALFIGLIATGRIVL